MRPDAQAMIAQLDVLLADFDALLAKSQYDDLSDLPVESGALANRFQAAIDRLTIPGDAYAHRADQQRARPAHARLPELCHIALALREDLKAGWTESIVEVIHGDMFGDYLDMAKELLAKGYQDAAAVITGSSLEVHLRALATKHGVATTQGTKPKKADTLNADLVKAGVYGGLQQKQVTSWLGLRNAAAHGQYSEYTAPEVKTFIDGVHGFMLKYSA